MNRFWLVTGGVLVLALAFLALETPSEQINFTDLETECRYDRTTGFDISLKPGNVLAFSGHYPVNNTEADLSYRYSRSGDTIKLDIIAKNETQAPANYFNSCLASVVYKAQTSSIPDGRYDVILKHDGQRVEHQVIGIK
ncbi:hypothetical protein GKQ38_03550 [Candidatus Nanohaloarchaea archaeon]|nr:hypothetical protein GKQ38_03550 [Candidatus Nanohaloarchaea archaeon]